MAQDTGIFIAVPEDIADKVLREGYRCSRRGKVPASLNIEAAKRAYRRQQRSRSPVLLQVNYLPAGVTAKPSRHKDGTQKDGIELSTSAIPSQCLSRVIHGHSVPEFNPAASSSFQPPARAASTSNDLRNITITTAGGIQHQIDLPGSASLAQLLHETDLPADSTRLLLRDRVLKKDDSLDGAGIVHGSILTAVVMLPVRCHHEHYGNILSVRDINFDAEKSLGAQWQTLVNSFGLCASEVQVFLVPSVIAPDLHKLFEHIILFDRYGVPVGAYAHSLPNVIAGTYDIVIYDHSG